MLLRNNNKKFIKTLSNNCLKTNKGRNLIAVLAILLTTVMFMALITIAAGVEINTREDRMRQAGSRLMVSVKYISEDEADALKENPAFTIAGKERFINPALNEEWKDMSVFIGWSEDQVAENMFMNLEQGQYPQEEDQVACDSQVLKLLGVPCEIGSTFTLKYQDGNGVQEKEMTLCGFWEGMEYEQTATLLVSRAFVDQVYATLGQEESLHTFNVRGSFASEENIEETLDQAVEELGYDPEAERGEEGFVIHNINPVYESTSTLGTGTLLSLGAGVLLILFAGYLIIYNIFKISVEKDIRLYGQLKTIGTSPAQIRYLISRQGMVLSAVGIPLGLILGLLLGNLLLPSIMETTSYGAFGFLLPPVWTWAAAAVFALVTVRISCSRPGRAAGRISPVEAMKYHGEQKAGKKSRKGRDSGNRIWQMAAANLGRNKGKTVLVVLSISLSSVLLNSVLNFTQSMDQEAYVRHSTAADFDVRGGDFAKDMQEAGQKTVPGPVAEALGSREEVSGFSKIYLREQQGNSIDTKQTQETLAQVLKINGETTPEDLTGFDRNRMIYGYNEAALKRAELIEGTIDYEKLCAGGYLILEGFLSDDGDYLEEAQEFHAGDVIEVKVADTIREYTVMAVIGGSNSFNAAYSSGGYESVVLPEETFLELFPENQEPIHCLFDAKEGSFDSLNAFLKSLEDRYSLSISTRLTAEAEFDRIRTNYNTVGVIVCLILGIVGVLNLINVIFTGVLARQREFASMRSIGMTRKQLRRLFVYEGICYALLAAVIGTVVSGAASVTLVRTFAAGLWFTDYSFTVLPAAAVSLICLGIAAGVSAVADRLWNQGSIVEQLREIE